MNALFTFTWKFFRGSLSYLISLIAPFTLLTLFTYFIPESSETIDGKAAALSMVGYLTVFAILMSSLIFCISQKYQDKLRPVSANLINGLVYSPLLFVTLILSNLPIIGAMAIVAAQVSSLYAAILPLLMAGIYISLKSTFAPFHLILEGKNPLSSIKSSFISTRGQITKIVLILLIFYFVTTVIELFTTVHSENSVIVQLFFMIGVALTLLMVALQQIAVFKLYVDSFDQNEKV